MRSRFALLALQRHRPGTFALLMAATSVLMLLAAALALALRSAARDLAGAAATRIIVQVVDADPGRRDTTADRVTARLDRMPGLGSAHRVPMAQAQALIAPYIGGVQAGDLPLPVLIEVDGGSPERLARAFRDLPAVQVTAAGAELGPLVRLVDALRAAAFGIGLIAAAATGLIAVLAARAALARERGTLDILHALGATDRQISYLVTGKIARDAAIGALIGLGIALIIIRAIAARIAAIGVGASPGLDAGGWIALLLLMAALVGLAMLAAQAALILALRRAP